MTRGRDIRTFGILMLVFTVVALVFDGSLCEPSIRQSASQTGDFNVYQALAGTAQPVVVGMLGITVGVGTYIVGEIMRQP